MYDCAHVMSSDCMWIKTLPMRIENETETELK